MEVPEHSCWRASFLASHLDGRPAKDTIYIPYISFMYSMYIYSYIHIWRADSSVNTPPANNYLQELKVPDDVSVTVEAQSTCMVDEVGTGRPR